MKILHGPPGAGTARAAEALFAERNRAGRAAFLVVSSDRAAAAARDRLVRSGPGFAPNRVISFAALLHSFTGQRTPSAHWTDHAVRQILPQSEEPRLRQYAASPAFRDRLRRLIDEIGWATADPVAAISSFRDPASASSPLTRELIRTIELVLRNATSAGFGWAGAIGALGPGSFRRSATYIFDGFREFTGPEESFLAVLDANTEVVLTLTDEWTGAVELRRRLTAAGAVVESIPDPGTEPQAEVVSAPTGEEEAAEIARRLLAAHRRGTPWAHSAILLRREGGFARLLRSTLTRFQIPVHDEFARPLAAAAPVRYYAALIQAKLSDWSHDDLLAAVRHGASPFQTDGTADRLAQSLTETRPARGFDLPELAAALAQIDGWPCVALPAAWASQLATLTALAYRGRQIDPRESANLALWRDRGAAMRSWPEALDRCATVLPPEPVPLQLFWQELQEVLRLMPYSSPPPIADAVTLTGVTDAAGRHWPVVYLPEMLEGVFPQRPAPDPLFGDSLRARLSEHGLPLKTSAERNLTEQALVRWALSGAGEAVVLSHSRFGPSGEVLDPSPALASIKGPRLTSVPCRPRNPERPPLLDPARPLAPIPPPSENYKYRTTEIEAFGKCPFLHFARHRLRLKPAPAPPGERFGFLEQGSLIHTVLHRFTKEGGDLMILLEEEFARTCRQKRIPLAHQVEFARLAIARNLRSYLERPIARRTDPSFSEWPFEITLTPGVLLTGRIDRFDLSPAGEATAIDYKYSNAANVRENVKSEAAVQGGLYLLALEQAGYRPLQFIYVPLRDDAEPLVLNEPIELMADARDKALAAVAAIQEHVPSARPVDPDVCRTCDFINVCRIREQEEASAEGSAG